MEVSFEVDKIIKFSIHNTVFSFFTKGGVVVEVLVTL